MRTLVHLLMGAAVAAGIGWTVHTAQQGDALGNIAKTFNQVDAKAQKAAENLFAH